MNTGNKRSKRGLHARREVGLHRLYVVVDLFFYRFDFYNVVA